MATSPMCRAIQQLRNAVLQREGAEITDGQLLDRFLVQRDEAALEALVRRHGPMVWGVCRRILHNHHDAEDAFQATFLVLVQKAAGISPREMVPNWLYGVAYQTALRARSAAARREARERQVTDMPEPAVVEQDLLRDLQPLLDEELSRLPDKYRVAIVLCDLEGKTRKETAQQLGVPEGTVAGRLARARAMLARRLSRHGLMLAGGALAAALSQKAVGACVPPTVMSSTIKAAGLFAAGQAAAGVISPQVAALRDGVIKAMLLSKLKRSLGVLLAVLGLGLGVGIVLGQPAPSGQPAAAPAEPKPGAKVRWEYKALTRDKIEKLAPAQSKDTLADGLNALGDQGWELVAVDTNPLPPAGGAAGFARGGMVGPGPGAPGGGARGGPGGGAGGGPVVGGGVMGMFGGSPSTYLFKRLK